MSEWVRMPVEVMADDRLTGLSAFVYATMLDKAVNGVARITADYVAEKLNKDQRSVRRAVKQLKECGYITDVIKGQSGNTHYVLKLVLPEKKRTKSEKASAPSDAPAPSQDGQMSFQTPPVGDTLEERTTPEERRILCELIATKLSGNVTPERCEKLLQGEYVKAKASAKDPINSMFAYLKKMILKWEPEEPKPEKSDFDVEKYKIFINDF